ncbi:hypothetical protein [Campylobacter sp. 19-13652]|uniref:hypothetical protein n=1 Tax=Campylobacter sp. 19-13652 TaxID=2840180 RepID=UPI001C73E554|nr:hypothetical protein [Campylobacter sp. 19-13652]BCX78589.1 hypothetical protein LBC_00510 [Campylobacter sp. 19-13652]
MAENLHPAYARKGASYHLASGLGENFSVKLSEIRVALNIIKKHASLASSALALEAHKVGSDGEKKYDEKLHFAQASKDNASS